MCKSLSEGGRRCDGRHLSLDDHANRAERRRAADRDRKAAGRTPKAVDQPVSVSLDTSVVSGPIEPTVKTDALDDDTAIDLEAWLAPGGKEPPEGYREAVAALPPDKRTALERRAAEVWVDREYGDIPPETKAFLVVGAATILARRKAVALAVYHMLHAPPGGKGGACLWSEGGKQWWQSGGPPWRSTAEVLFPEPDDLHDAIRKAPVDTARFTRLERRAEWGVLAPAGTAEDGTIEVTKKDGTTTMRKVGLGIPLGASSGMVLFL